MLIKTVDIITQTKDNEIKTVDIVTQSKDNEIKVGDIIYHYKLEKLIGSGSFGKVYKSTNIKTGKIVAIKIIKSEGGYSRSANKERYFLEKLTNNPHVVKMLEWFQYLNYKCIVCELLEYSLYDWIIKTKYNGLPLQTVSKIGLQLLSFLRTLLPQPHVDKDSINYKGLIHCDLKPENILISDIDENKIKIIDFGLSCFSGTDITTYVQSRYYRAPEIILGLDFSNQIDMWSLGCILAEIYTGKSLFPGKDNDDQLDLIISTLGEIPQEMLDKRKSYDNIKMESDQIIPRVPIVTIDRPKRTLKDFLNVKGDYNDDFLNLITEMLQIDPVLRITPEKALVHSFFKVSGQKRKAEDII